MAAKQKVVGVDRDVPVYDAEGVETTTTVVLPAEIFDVPLNIPLIHQVVEAQRAAARQGTASTKTRGEVSGGGKKPWRQKGTGRARQGSIRAPQWTGGGVVHGPKPRDYSQRTPKKMKAGALRSALSDRARNDAIFVFEGMIATDRPSTKVAIATLRNVTDARKVLVVIDRDEFGADIVVKSYSNIPGVHVLWSDQLNTYDVIDAERVTFTEAALDSYITRVMRAWGRLAEETVEVEVEEGILVAEEEKADKVAKEDAK